MALPKTPPPPSVDATPSKPRGRPRGRQPAGKEWCYKKNEWVAEGDAELTKDGMEALKLARRRCKADAGKSKAAASGAESPARVIRKAVEAVNRATPELPPTRIESEEGTVARFLGPKLTAAIVALIDHRVQAAMKDAVKAGVQEALTTGTFAPEPQAAARAIFLD